MLEVESVFKSLKANQKDLNDMGKVVEIVTREGPDRLLMTTRFASGGGSSRRSPAPSHSQINGIKFFHVHHEFRGCAQQWWEKVVAMAPGGWDEAVANSEAGFYNHSLCPIG